ncbi:hypothetical protein AGABI1DRAFT_36686 [Agaricus bisporus var. burnettii JB137-S8]|uniref:TROVE domain-containing protein n=1 Tax=Agaricus bisporus var. burnettii (strain JB137-S8 / ATCC MYA-4627 / FGSC 10392) TaxID=597362 RepID=K5Y0J3_AGABU|nr:uncharacterized protein AGABI1DRAFT_36686 [Agaricus bisporus var. burnettii JB137-S8]EKM81275.1 hypothetical protein AGABI1DRAFT_36686 [Agaricus bisporus var. burnettii JB137-S8]
MKVDDALHFPTNSFIARLKSDDRAYNTKSALALNSTGSAILDAFNFLDRWSYDEVNRHLEKAWKEDPALALKLIWNLRSIHDGKNEKELFYRAFGWLYDNHPRTALSNLHMLVSPSCVTSKGKGGGLPHGYWKDLLNILALATCGELSNITEKATFLHNYSIRKNHRSSTSQKPKKTPEQIKAYQERESMRAQEKKKELRRQFHERLTKKLESDSKYRALYITVARMFAEQIQNDMKVMEELKKVDIKEDKQRWSELLRSISLAGKWAPSPSGSHDCVTNISTAICQILFSTDGSRIVGPLPSAAPYLIPNNAENCNILRSFYRRWVLKPLRELIRSPRPLTSGENEMKQTKNQYSRIPSICMARNKSHFIQHNPNGFGQYIADVENGKKKISGATLLPHELVSEAVRLQEALGKAKNASKFPLVVELKKRLIEQEIQVVNAQWRTLVERMKENGSLENCIAICDVSSDMGYLNHHDGKRVAEIFPAIGLTLMLASLTKPPFNAGFIAFARAPEFVSLEDLEKKGLVSVVDMLSRRRWHERRSKVDLQGVFKKLVLSVAKEHKIAKEDMVKRVFVFSDMEFDEDEDKEDEDDSDHYDDHDDYMEEDDEDDSDWEEDTNDRKTAQDRVEQAYKKAGYDVPEIVYWSLTGSYCWSQTVQVKSDRKGTAIMSGLSPTMLKVFMTGDEVEGSMSKEELTPMGVVKKILNQKSFDGLVVVD